MSSYAKSSVFNALMASGKIHKTLLMNKVAKIYLNRCGRVGNIEPDEKYEAQQRYITAQ